MQNEKELLTPIREKLEKRGYTVFVNINPASYKYKDYWKQWFGEEIPPLQPQIDILLVDKQFSVRAIEIKYFDLKEKRIDGSYYEGIGETLALMNYGFESVALWHFFNEKIPLKSMNNYAIHIANLRQSFNLPIDYTCLQVKEENGVIKFKTLPSPERDWLIDDIPSTIEWRSSNPLKYQAEPKKILDFIRHILRIPTK